MRLFWASVKYSREQGRIQKLSVGCDGGRGGGPVGLRCRAPGRAFSPLPESWIHLYTWQSILRATLHMISTLNADKSSRPATLTDAGGDASLSFSSGFATGDWPEKLIQIGKYNFYYCYCHYYYYKSGTRLRLGCRVSRVVIINTVESAQFSGHSSGSQRSHATTARLGTFSRVAHPQDLPARSRRPARHGGNEAWRSATAWEQACDVRLARASDVSSVWDV